jgi:hypothetical protein
MYILKQLSSILLRISVLRFLIRLRVQKLANYMVSLIFENSDKIVFVLLHSTVSCDILASINYLRSLFPTE